MRSLVLRTAIVIGCGAVAWHSHSPLVLAAPIPAAQKATPNNAQIRAYIEGEAQKIAGEDPAARSEGRKSLIDSVNDGAPVFYDVYALELNNALLPLAKHEQMAVRLNAAIAAAKVAQKVDSFRLAPVTLELLSDKAEPVQLWALRAAKATLPKALVADPRAPLIQRISELGTNSKSGLIVQEAYDALSLNADNPTIGPRIPKQHINAVVPEVQDIMRRRVEQYGGDTVPSAPQAEQKASKLLTSTTVWQAQTPQQRTQTAQLILDLLTYAAAKIDALPEGVDRERLVGVFKDVGATLHVIGTNTNSRDLQQASLPLTGIRSGQNVAPMLAPVLPLLQKAVPGVKATPAAPAAADSTTRPSTGPAAGLASDGGGT